MVHDLALIDAQIDQNAGSTGVLPDLESLRNPVIDWRDYRKGRFSKAKNFTGFEKDTFLSSNLSLRMRTRRNSFRGAIESTG
jgi:hypothetical protein